MSLRACIAKQLCRLRTDERGAVAVTMGILILPLMGFLALGFEATNWYLITRGMQNAADAAAIAAAFNNGANYDVEGKAVAAQYGFVDGTNNVSITISNTAPCPAGGNNCYSAAISGYTPLLLSQVLGFQGDANLNGAQQKRLNASAVAKPMLTPNKLCLVALATSGVAQGIRANGSSTSNMNGCDSMSNSAAVCNGSNLGLGNSFANGQNSGCGSKQYSSPKLTDPYAYLASNVPPLSDAGCGGNYPQISKHGNSYTGGTAIKDRLDLNAGNNFRCGDQQLTADTVIYAPPGQPAVLVIENGQLDLNGHKLTSSNGTAVTLVFSGTNGGGYQHNLADNTNGPGGLIDIAGPTSGPWSGVAVYQDPNLTSGVDVSAAGNSPTWNITGLIYMPHASLTLKGAIDKSNVGKQCVVMIADNFQISGTGGIMKTNTGQCDQAGLTMPTANIPGGVALVQ